MNRKYLSLLLVLLVSAAPWFASAEDIAADELAVFDGETRLDYAGHPAFQFSTPATVEFWIAPSWLETAEFDPCVVSSLSENSVNFAICIGADRNSIGLYAGEKYASLPFDLSDDNLHHVAVISMTPEFTEVVVDGESQGLLELGFLNQGSSSFHLGSLDGEQSPFMGLIGRLPVRPGTKYGEDQPA